VKTMSNEESVRRASQWWDSVGRKRIAKVANHREEGRRYSHGNVAIRVAPEMVPEMTESGIMMGLPFAKLTVREARRVVDAWRREFIDKPERDPTILPE
jgi:hypothetical protein